MTSNVIIVLVNPSHPGNMGAAARAMKNMGFEHLRLVKPQRKVNEESYARSAGAHSVLDNAEYFDDLKTAIADCHCVMGTSARFKVPEVRDLPLRESARVARTIAPQQKVAILFGREHAGLTNEELALCHYHVYIPCNPNFSSLNLAAAVQVVCYELYVDAMERCEKRDKFDPSEFEFSYPIQTTKVALATQQEIELLFEHLEKTLAAIDFYDRTNPRRLMPKLRGLFNRTQLLASEVAILRGILTAMDKCRSEPR